METGEYKEMLTIEELRQKENDYKSRLAQVEEFLKIEEKDESIATANRRNSHDSQIVTSLFSK